MQFITNRPELAKSQSFRWPAAVIALLAATGIVSAILLGFDSMAPENTASTLGLSSAPPTFSASKGPRDFTVAGAEVSRNNR